MRHKLFLAIANTGLLGLVVALLAGPLLLGQLLGSSQSGALGAMSAAPAGRNMTVYQNTTDFAQYASFNPSPLIEPTFYQTSVTYTTFAGQQAAYNGLFTVYNAGTSTMVVRADVGRLSGQLSPSDVWVTLSPANHSTATLITDAAAAGVTNLKVADASGFNGGNVVIGEAVLHAKKVSATELLLDKPLAQAVAAGDKVYLGAALYAKQADAVIGSTQNVTLAPGERASLTLTVATAGGDGQGKVVMPISIVGE